MTLPIEPESIGVEGSRSLIGVGELASVFLNHHQSRSGALKPSITSPRKTEFLSVKRSGMKQFLGAVAVAIFSGICLTAQAARPRLEVTSERDPGGVNQRFVELGKPDAPFIIQSTGSRRYMMRVVAPMDWASHFANSNATLSITSTQKGVLTREDLPSVPNRAQLERITKLLECLEIFTSTGVVPNSVDKLLTAPANTKPITHTKKAKRNEIREELEAPAADSPSVFMEKMHNQLSWELRQSARWQPNAKPEEIKNYLKVRDLLSDLASDLLSGSQPNERRRTVRVGRVASEKGKPRGTGNLKEDVKSIRVLLHDWSGVNEWVYYIHCKRASDVEVKLFQGKIELDKQIFPVDKFN